jgi:uncharacterized membrane-anchored protein YhcB (DUF1043 family)
MFELVLVFIGAFSISSFFIKGFFKVLNKLKKVNELQCELNKLKDRLSWYRERLEKLELAQSKKK